VVDALSYRDSKLMGVDQSAELTPVALSCGCFGQQVLVLAEQNATR
jgi:hypothetical protein